jgi:hypothetical protein
LKHRDDNPNEHERFKELAAAATADALSSGERAELEAHLRDCEECLCVFKEYEVLAGEDFRMLTSACEHPGSIEGWNEEEARRRLLVAAEALEEPKAQAKIVGLRRYLTWHTAGVGALAASVMFLVAIGAWRLGQQGSHATSVAFSANDHQVELRGVTKSTDAALAAQPKAIARLEAANAAKHLEIGKLESQLRILQQRMNEERLAARGELNDLAEAKAGSDARVSSLSLQRDMLSEQLRDSRQAAERTEAELAGLRSEHGKALTKLNSVENRLTEVTAISQEQGQRLKDAEQFLSSDRDIRDLMSARNLYIADVFDVDSNSRTRKPFGRIFYTRGKSLLFYAFDLDRQARVKETSAFQVWGQKETAEGEAARPLDLGILYLDSESNRRWALRFNDPQTLAQIDAVFVTVEPRGGSRKPTGKPFLFAMLRKEANHP